MSLDSFIIVHDSEKDFKTFFLWLGEFSSEGEMLGVVQSDQNRKIKKKEYI